MNLIVGFLDAGQGDCTVIVYPDNSITVVDMGSKKNGAIVSGQIIQALNLFLPNNGNVIDTLVLTHADLDHYNLVLPLLGVAGAPAVNQVYYGNDISLYPANMQAFINARNPVSPGNGNPFFPPPPLAADLGLSRAGVQVYVLACNALGTPTSAVGPIKNGNSLCLMVSYEGVKLFLMGDSNFGTENAILAYCAAAGTTGALLTKDYQNVLKLGHHGSAGSSSQAWVQAITPDTVFCSADTSTFNGTGMPSDTLLNNIQGWTALDNTAFLHQWVQFNTTTQNFELAPAAGQTQLELCTTLYNYQLLTPTTFQTTGGAWYYEVQPQGPGNDPKIIWGFTG